MAIAESWLDSKISKALIDIPGYIIFRKDHRHGRDGDVLYCQFVIKYYTPVRPSITGPIRFKRYMAQSGDCISLYYKVSIIYSFPNSTLQYRITIFNKIKSASLDCTCIVVGDFNLSVILGR